MWAIGGRPKDRKNGGYRGKERRDMGPDGGRNQEREAKQTSWLMRE